VKQDWAVELNGRRLGKLFLMEADLILAIRIPAGALHGERICSPLCRPKKTMTSWCMRSGSIRDS